MDHFIRTTIVKKTRKDHWCNACEWLTNTEALSMIKSGEIKTTISERRTIIKAKKNGWKVKRGESAIYTVCEQEGEIFGFHSIPEIHEICKKYEIYEDL